MFSASLAERLRAEDLCRDKRYAPMAPNVLDMERGEAYAHWLRDGELDADILMRAHLAAIESVREIGDDYFKEGYALAAARIALVMNKPELVGPALGAVKRWRCPASNGMRLVLEGLAECFKIPRQDDKDQRIEAFNDLFEAYRPPHPDNELTDIGDSLSIVRFELAVIHVQIDSRKSVPDLEAVYSAVVG